MATALVCRPRMPACASMPELSKHRDGDEHSPDMPELSKHRGWLEHSPDNSPNHTRANILPPIFGASSPQLGYAKGALRHVRSPASQGKKNHVQCMLQSTRSDVALGIEFVRGHSPQDAVDALAAEGYGRMVAGSNPWEEAVFFEADGADETTSGYLLPAEFAMLAGRFSRILGDPPRGQKFSIDFRDCDLDMNGKVWLQEWKKYATILEDIFGRSRCRRAALRFCGERRAENRTKMCLEECRSGVYVFRGYNAEASLRLVRTCARPTDLGLLLKVEAALSKRADPNCALADEHFNGYTPLIFLAMAQTRASTAVNSRVVKAIDLLVSAKADVHRQCLEMPFGTWVPLRFAAQLQSVAGVEALLNHVNVGDRFAWAAGENVQFIMLAELRRICSEEVCQTIAGFSKYDNQATVLMQLFSSNIVGANLTASRATKLLSGQSDDETVLRQGACADPNGAGLDGTTALMNVCIKGDVDVAKALLEGKASPCQANSSGATPLHLAAAYLHPEIARLLLDARAEPHALDLAGFSPWMLVAEMKHEIGAEEREHIHDMLEMLKPQLMPQQIIDMCERNWIDLIDSDGASLEVLSSRLRLQESLFFNHKVVRRAAYEGRERRDDLLTRVAKLIMSMLKADPLKGPKKELTKYLLHATTGPSQRTDLEHSVLKWPWSDNREAYRADLKVVVKRMMSGFAEECNVMKTTIEDNASMQPSGMCAAMRAVPEDIVIIPESWQKREPYWQKVQERQILRFDPPWARAIHDHATCCQALLRLGNYTARGVELGPVTDLSGFSHLIQVGHASMQELVARGYIKYSQICNAAFQERMKIVARHCAEREGLDLRPPKKLVGAKKLKRLMEKTRDAQEERNVEKHGLWWPGLEEKYHRFSYCFHILDTVRLSFTCCGFKTEDRHVESDDESDLALTAQYAVHHCPPEREDGQHLFADLFDELPSTGYIGPDRQGTTFEHCGDASFFFVLDLGETMKVERMEMINAHLDAEKYNVREYEVGMSDDLDDIKTRPGAFPTVSTSEVQNVRVKGVGRYLRFNMKKYGLHSVGISHLKVVLAAEDEVTIARQREEMDAQVTSCMKLLEEFRGLTWEKDRACVLRQKSGFAAGFKGAGGYADIKLLILADLGKFEAFDGEEVEMRIVGEVQLILRGFQEVKDRMHLAYEADRGSFGPICWDPS